jgi:hypothetical protein
LPSQRSRFIVILITSTLRPEAPHPNQPKSRALQPPEIL